MKTNAAAVALLATLTACSTVPQPNEGTTTIGHPVHLTHIALDEMALVDGPKVKPLTLIEDSRCPMGTQCVWPRRLRIRIAVELGSGTRVHEIALGQSIPIADGTLELVTASPQRTAKSAKRMRPEDYVFGFRFMGGI